jgi:hypothetical protein
MLFMPGIAFNLLLIRTGEQRALLAAEKMPAAKKRVLYPAPRHILRFEMDGGYSDMDSGIG